MDHNLLRSTAAWVALGANFAAVLAPVTCSKGSVKLGISLRSGKAQRRDEDGHTVNGSDAAGDRWQIRSRACVRDLQGWCESMQGGNHLA